jgi:AcrR family transcriptional regulator
MSLSRQEDFLTKGRQNQKQRTREALLDAAMTLASDGHSPTIAEVAEAARVSIATAYRYFPNPQSLWADMASRARIPGYPELLEHLPDDPEAAIDEVVRQVAGFQFANEAVWRGVLRATLDRWFSQVDVPEEDRVPTRGITRLQMAGRALEPLRNTLRPKDFERLISAVVLVFGIEAMVSARDVVGLSAEDATEVMRWAAQALVRAALADAED